MSAVRSTLSMPLVLAHLGIHRCGGVLFLVDTAEGGGGVSVAVRRYREYHGASTAIRRHTPPSAAIRRHPPRCHVAVAVVLVRNVQVITVHGAWYSQCDATLQAFIMNKSFITMNKLLIIKKLTVASICFETFHSTTL